MANVWLFQHPTEVKRVGKEKAPWCVGWYEPDGTRRQKTLGSGSAGKKAAFRLSKKIEAELLAGVYQSDARITWKAFVAEWRENIMPTMSDENARCADNTLKHFERLVKLTTVERIGAKQIDAYVSRRSLERGRLPGSKISPATLNKELRYLRAALNIAQEWGYLPSVPKFSKKWKREPRKLKRFVTPEHFDLIYAAADAATRPQLPNVSPPQWWRTFLAFAYLTGWRVSEIRSLRWSDVDFTHGTAITRHADNKADRDEAVGLDPVILEHLQTIRTFGEFVFPWPQDRRSMWSEFGVIQAAAGIHLECHEDHKHSESCHFYGFHDIRRAFATENAASLPAVHLQRLMRHKAWTTTQGYITLAETVRPSAAVLFKPDSLKPDGGEMVGN